MNKTIISFFYENSISFNVADSSSFPRMIEEILFKVTKPLPANDYMGSSLTRLTGQQATCSSDSCYCLKVWIYWQSLNTRPSSARLHARLRGGDSRTRIVQDAGQARGAEAPRRSFRPDARCARPASAPRAPRPTVTLLVDWQGSSDSWRQARPALLDDRQRLPLSPRRPGPQSPSCPIVLPTSQSLRRYSLRVLLRDNYSFDLSFPSVPNHKFEVQL